MSNFFRPLLFLCIVMAISMVAATNAMADKIGVASAVVNQVQAGNNRTLAVGSDVFAHEHIRTSDASTAQLLFLDKTSVSIGPRADLVLDSFVYDPNKGTGRVVVNATQGAFRFITGSQNPTNYAIKTPVATLGIRGTILDFLLTGSPTTGFSLTVIVVECCADMTLPNGQVVHLNQAGMAYTVTNAGVQGPFQWDGSIVTAGGLQFPLLGWYFQGEIPPGELPPGSQIGGIDQLNGIIQSQLGTITEHHNNGCQSEECGFRQKR
jgi:DNA-binding transcriptional regulator YdaS (Cro superfamily)